MSVERFDYNNPMMFRNLNLATTPARGHSYGLIGSRRFGCITQRAERALARSTASSILAPL